MTDENEQAGTPDDARYDRGAMDFIEATIALSDLGAKFAATPHPTRPAQELPPDSMWAPVDAAHQTIGEQVTRAAGAVHARAAALSIDNARAAVEYGQQHGIPVPQHIIDRARASQDD
jgi:nucleotide-binding universal stress UspA family protein